MRFILFLVAVSFLAAVTGCGKPTRRGGTLSGAATEASKPPEEQKTVVQRRVRVSRTMYSATAASFN